MKATMTSFLLMIVLNQLLAQTPEDGRAAIEAVAASFSAAYVRGDVEGMMECYAANAVIMPGGRDIISNRDSIRLYWTLPPGRRITHHKSTPVEITIVGTTAYDYGYYEGASTQDAKPAVTWGGKYVIVWVKEDDGKWRMKIDIWNR
jgi:ketosteroid isomerase-like protein